MGKKTLSISDARDEDAAYFRSLATKTKPLNKVFTEVLEAHRGIIPAAVSSSEVENNQALIQENQDLKAEIEAQKFASNNFIKELNTLANKIKDLETELEAKKDQNPAEKIQFPSFIYTPQAEQLAQIKRYFALLRKKGQITTDTPNLPQTLTNKAINYLFKNEYPEVIK